ncbi:MULTISPECIES: nuclear transport factor 2 family protein [unclassified Enterococcus]|uniref:nuclear transport factor 2 family protein n=1 Tax=unclassified Enterococcus TaxID=2608891 RepID=UPI0013EAAA18|nr:MULTISPECIES: nuclear transport factor 2 family protein [unclassified Enterococcus]
MNQEEQVLQVARNQIEAIIQKDFSKLNELIASKAIFTHITGEEQTRDEWLNQMKQGRMNYLANEEKKVTVQLTSSTKATVTMENLLKARIYGFQNTWPLRSVTQLEKIAGNWQITASQSKLF